VHGFCAGVAAKSGTKACNSVAAGVPIILKLLLPVCCKFVPMIAIDNILVSDEVVKAQFVCDLSKCKGACCVDGDAGAPLEKAELQKINEVFDDVLPYLNEESKKEIEKQGRYVYDKEYGWVTPTINSKVCVYGIKDKQGVVKCGIEQAYLDKKVEWKKPLSCHLFPVITKESKRSDNIYVNYEPREDNCKAACSLGKKLKVPVYIFLKESLVRKFGQKFYEALDATAKHLNTPNP
jgi:Protein of unknown function (DUF3109)